VKKITAQQFQQDLLEQAGKLKPGQIVVVTQGGKPLLHVTKAGSRRRKVTNLSGDIMKHKYSTEIGDQLLAALTKDLA
jgi:hypothetical protein